MARESNFVCTACGNDDVAPRDRFAERHEYRSVDARERLYTKTTRLMCRRCVLLLKDGEVEELTMFSFDDDASDAKRFTS